MRRGLRLPPPLTLTLTLTLSLALAQRLDIPRRLLLLLWRERE